MKNAFLAALAIVLLSTQGQAAPASDEAPSLRDQIRADRAKSKAEFDSSPTQRAWDRDANGKRPWDRKEAPLPKE
jgi:hypothetical protein